MAYTQRDKSVYRADPQVPSRERGQAQEGLTQVCPGQDFPEAGFRAEQGQRGRLKQTNKMWVTHTNRGKPPCCENRSSISHTIFVECCGNIFVTIYLS